MMKMKSSSSRKKRTLHEAKSEEEWDRIVSVAGAPSDSDGAPGAGSLAPPLAADDDEPDPVAELAALDALGAGHADG